jgi:hypothetical protein
MGKEKLVKLCELLEELWYELEQQDVAVDADEINEHLRKLRAVDTVQGVAGNMIVKLNIAEGN